MNKKNSFFWVLVFVLLGVGMLDLFTALSGPLLYEANPVFVLSGGSVWWLVFSKIVSLSMIIYFLWYVYNSPSCGKYVKFFMAFMVVSVVVSQLIGMTSNIISQRQVDAIVASGGTPAPPAPADKVVVGYLIVEALTIYYPLLLAMLAFFIYERFEKYE